MEISILGLKLNLEVLILIGVVYLILVGHTLGGCCNMNAIMEGMNDMATMAANKDEIKAKMQDKMVQKAPSSMPGGLTQGMVTSKEGFVGANTNYGNSASYTLGNDIPVNTSSWGRQSLVVTPGQPIPPAAQAILDRPSQPIPLPEGQLSMFANTPFKPECCPNTYSNSSGCACMTSEQYNYLITRSGNNVPYSEY